MHDDALIGTWLLRSHRMEDRETGETTEPFGATPSGVLIIGADGRMAALITPGHGSDVADPAAMIAYSGRYRLTPGRFDHHRRRRLVRAVGRQRAGARIMRSPATRSKSRPLRR